MNPILKAANLLLKRYQRPFAAALCVLILFVSYAIAQTIKVSQLPELTSATSDDLMLIVDSPSGGAITKKITFGHVQSSLSGLIESQLSFSDLLTLNVSTSKHGLVPKAPNDTTKFLRGDGTWAAAGLGSVTSVGSGSGLTGGPITTSGSLIWAPDTFVNNLTFWDGANASRTLTFNLSGTDPVLTFTSGVVNLSAGALQVGGSAVLTGNQTITLSGDVSGSGATSITTSIGAGVVTNTMLAGSIAITKLSITGTPDGTKFLRDDGSWQPTGGGNPFEDGTAIIKGSGDASKLLRFEVDGFTASTTRVLTPQNASYTIAGTDLAQTFTSPQTFSTSTVSTPVTLSDGATIATDASLGNRFRVSSAVDRTLGAPTNGTDGQQCVWSWTNSDSSAHTLTLDTGTGGFRFGSDLTSISATAAGKTDHITAIYNSTDNKWDVVGNVKGY